jgi:hypothetical protein
MDFGIMDYQTSFPSPCDDDVLPAPGEPVFLSGRFEELDDLLSNAEASIAVN